MKHELTKEQIVKAYNNPELLKKLFPAAFLEAGKWYFITIGKQKALFNFSGNYSEENEPLGYGIGYDNLWGDLDEFGWDYETIKPATNEQVQEALIKEAKKRGYKAGVIVECINGQFQIKIINDYFKFVDKTNSLFLNNTCIFKNGKWAEIIETEIELTLQEIAEKFGVNKVKIKE